MLSAKDDADDATLTKESTRAQTLHSVSTATAEELERQVKDYRIQKEESEESCALKEKRLHVFARVRPVLDDEVLGTVTDRGGVMINEFECVSTRGNKIILHEEVRSLGGAGTGRLSHKEIQFDKVFSGTRNDDVYAVAVAPLLASAMSCVIMFGQTNSGKTYTATGVAERCVKEVSYPLRISCVEVAARDTVRDLLIEKPEPCVLRDDGKGGLVVAGATESIAANPYEALQLVRLAGSRRATRATRANQESSRSHAVLSLQWGEQKSLSICDLAGSERRQEALFDDADALEETKAINTALSVLKDCIRAILKKDSYVPFRRSALTRILRSALDVSHHSEVRTSFIAHLAPTNLSLLHTKNTIDYCIKMRDIASDTDRRKANLGPERWTSTRLRQWVFDTFKNEEKQNIEKLSEAFASISGKQMATIWRGELVRRIEAAGFPEATADKVYDAFHDMNRRFKKKVSSVKSGPSTRGSTGRLAPPLSAAALSKGAPSKAALEEAT